MNRSKLARYALLLPVLAGFGWMFLSRGEGTSARTTAPTRPAIAVRAVLPEVSRWPTPLPAAGLIAAWQEAVIGAEVSNLPLSDVRVNVGDRVKKGQLLARISPETVDHEVAEAKAALAELEAALAEAEANLKQARALAERGFYSAQQALQKETARQSAAARTKAGKARLESALLRRDKTLVRAPDDGIISAQSAAVGSLTQPGQALFRLIRASRLEWRAEVTGSERLKLPPGTPARITAPDGSPISGTVRQAAPTVDPANGNGLVYVDLPPEAAGKLAAGSFVQGEFTLPEAPALSLPQSAVRLQEGFAWVFVIEAPAGEKGGDNPQIARVLQKKIRTGRRLGERVEVFDLPANTPVVERGAGFLADGDHVRLAEEVAPVVAARPAAAADTPPGSAGRP